VTRTDAILAALTALLGERRRELDAATDLRVLVLDLKFSPDRLEPRAIVDRIERERRRDENGGSLRRGRVE
jgi:hypothetical protein